MQILKTHTYKRQLGFVKILNTNFKYKIESKLLRPPVNPGVHQTCLTSQYYTAAGSINVTDYGKYAWVDVQAVSAI